MRPLAAYLAAFPGDDRGLLASTTPRCPRIAGRPHPRPQPTGSRTTGSSVSSAAAARRRLPRRGHAAPPPGRAQGADRARAALRGRGRSGSAARPRSPRSSTIPASARVYDAGVESGVPYIAMRYVEGETLAERIAAARRRGACDRVDTNEARLAASSRPRDQPSDRETRRDRRDPRDRSRRRRARCTPRTRPASSTATSSPATSWSRRRASP